MSAESRRELISKLQALLGPEHRVMAFVNGVRPWKGMKETLATQIAQDSVRICYDHLAALSRGIAKQKLKIDLFLFSFGGDTSVPWRLVSLFREFAGEFRVIVPYVAMSAATMICLGADEIVMGRKGELGPIDPSMTDPAILRIEGTHPLIGVEDVSNYVSFVRERCNVRQPALIARAVELLTAQVGPIGLGKLNRQHSYIRLVGERLLNSRRRANRAKIKPILRTLIEDGSFHGHAISRSEARNLGLHVRIPQSKIEEAIWALYLEFERDFELFKPIDQERWLAQATGDVVDSSDLVLGGIESPTQTDNFVYKFRFHVLRQTPPNVTIQIQLPGIATLPTTPDDRRLFQQLIQEAIEKASPAVTAALRAQAPFHEVRREILRAEWATVWKEG